MPISIIEPVIAAFEVAYLNERRPGSETFGEDVCAGRRPKECAVFFEAGNFEFSMRDQCMMRLVVVNAKAGGEIGFQRPSVLERCRAKADHVAAYRKEEQVAKNNCGMSMYPTAATAISKNGKRFSIEEDAMN
jgi:hypothetical protein